MSDYQRACLLRIYLGEDDRHQGRPLYERIVLAARERHLAGATVLRGPLGFGHNSRIHSAKVLRLSEDLPIVIEIVDDHEKIEAFVSVVEKLFHGGLVTLEDVRVVTHKADDHDGP